MYVVDEGGTSTFWVLRMSPSAWRYMVEETTAWAAASAKREEIGVAGSWGGGGYASASVIARPWDDAVERKEVLGPSVCCRDSIDMLGSLFAGLDWLRLACGAPSLGLKSDRRWYRVQPGSEGAEQTTLH